MGCIRCFACLTLLSTFVTFSVHGQEPSARDRQSFERILNAREDAGPVPADHGFGPGVKPSSRALTGPQAQAAGVPTGVSSAHTLGVFGAPFAWPINAIHVALLPNGRVLNYGTDQRGVQGAQLIYDVWDPQKGTGTVAHTVLPNTTSTDIFCSGQAIINATGRVLITGGDLIVNGKRNYSNNRTTIFSPQSNTLSSGAPMRYARWYPAVITLANGELLVLGGRQAPGTVTATPEVFSPSNGWRTLWNATSDAAFGAGWGNWYYPRAFVAPNGQVLIWSYSGSLFYLQPAGNGTLTQLTPKTVTGRNDLPAVMYAPGKVMSLRSEGKVAVVNLNGSQPIVKTTGNVSQVRIWSNATVLADGKVLVTGGSTASNQLVGVAHHAELWNPATGLWTRGASDAKARLYHASALLLPDATVLSAGGGAPGPVNNLNAEIYYPPYLYRKDGSGLPAPRPSIVSASATARVGQQLVATMGSAAPISRVTIVRLGSMTHSFNADQRFLALSFSQSGQKVTATIPGNRHNALPGYYLLFVFDQAGVPSIAKIVKLVL